jgi:LysM repeat protein
MNTSNLSDLKKINRIILCAGHGHGDSGAVDADSVEADDTIRMTNRIASNLRSKGLEVIVVPHDKNLSEAISWVNANYKNWTDGWAIEIHRDSANVNNNQETSDRCGCYYHADYSGSKEVSDRIRDLMKENGASANTWSRADTAAGPGRLGWIRNTNPYAHLLELGFIQGDSSNDHLDWLADLASKVIYEAFTGQKYTNSAAYYTVQKGDTLSKIASKFGITLAQIKAWNPQYSTNWSLIYAGQKVRVG